MSTISIVATAALSHLVRRDVFASRSSLVKRFGAADDVAKYEASSWGVALIVVSAVVFAALLVIVEYSLISVVGTLTMIEEPSHAIAVTANTPSEELEAQTNKAQQERLLETATASITVVDIKPITTSIRGTLKHLKARTGGRRSYLRGFGALVIYSVLFNITTTGLSVALGMIWPRIVPAREVVAATIAAVLLSRFAAAWNHCVISAPPGKSFFKRVTPLSSWKALALPAAVDTAVPYLAFYTVIKLGMALGLHENPDASRGAKDVWVQLSKLSVFASVSVLLILFISMPAAVTLARVQASLLPEEDETIVPFDRTFDGKVVPRILGGTGAIGFVDAWKSFTWEARRRLVKLYLKIGGIVVAMFIGFFLVLVGEVLLILAFSRRIN